MQNIVNPNTTRNITGSTVKNHELSKRQTRVNNRSARRGNVARKVSNVNRSAVSRNINELGAHRNTHAINTKPNSSYAHGLNHTNNMINYYGDAIHNLNDGPVVYGNAKHGLSQAVAASTSDGDFTFFKRNKSDKNEAPTSPEPGQQQVPNRGNPMTPQPTSMQSTSPSPGAAPVPVAPPRGTTWNYDYGYDRIHDVGDVTHDRIHDVGNVTRDHIHDVGDEARDRIHDVGNVTRHRIHNADDAGYDKIHNLNDDGEPNGYDGRYGNQLKPLPKSEPGKATPAHRVNRRVMK